MERYGYVRISAKDQNPDRQFLAMKEQQIKRENIYLDIISGKSFERPQYRKMLKKLRKGDVLIVKSIDRLGRNYEEILEQWRMITKEIGVDIYVIDMPLLNTNSQHEDLTGTFIADLVLQILAYVAETERAFIKQRQTEGIIVAKQKGVRFGRKKKELPLTSSGKINRKGLPQIDLENMADDVEYIAPGNENQKELCKILESVLGTTPIGITDDFFELGGDSLKAIEYVSKAHNEGIYFNLQNVFDYSTVKELCQCIENGDKQQISFDNIDFTKVNKILERNSLEYLSKPEKSEIGNLLLAGATGYLGIHILADYLDNDTGTAYCIVRGKNKEESTKRFKELLHFYFDDKYEDMRRIEVICGNLQQKNLGMDKELYDNLADSVDTVINSAASVKHYGSYQYFYETNVETVKCLIEFCKQADARFIHTSTLSVSGNSFADQFDGYVSEVEKHFYESSLYIGQPLDNVYARSKFEAEKIVLEAIAGGLKANIMRMGNLTNRLSDGVFQKNYESNAFLQRIKAVLGLGKVPDYLMDLYAEFTPIDEAAKAVMTITRHFNMENTVFHINSTKVVYMDKLYSILNELGFDIEIIRGNEFTVILRQTMKKSGMEYIFETFINDMDENDRLSYDSNIHIENDFTVKYLQMLGFEWSQIDLDYLKKYFDYFKTIGYIGG